MIDWNNVIRLVHDAIAADRFWCVDGREALIDIHASLMNRRYAEAFWKLWELSQWQAEQLAKVQHEAETLETLRVAIQAADAALKRAAT